jgi:hypothetical protein
MTLMISTAMEMVLLVSRMSSSEEGDVWFYTVEEASNAGYRAPLNE